ncbi:MAG: hypothetical protein QM626_03410 [Microbacterium sp.]|uniref:hypothetical protein n=1 Tax=Microbacterium sp. TaxID=51671 RepID=UPI0039E3B58A
MNLTLNDGVQMWRHPGVAALRRRWTAERLSALEARILEQSRIVKGLYRIETELPVRELRVRRRRARRRSGRRRGGQAARALSARRRHARWSPPSIRFPRRDDHVLSLLLSTLGLRLTSDDTARESGGSATARDAALLPV